MCPKCLLPLRLLCTVVLIFAVGASSHLEEDISPTFSPTVAVLDAADDLPNNTTAVSVTFATANDRGNVAGGGVANGGEDRRGGGGGGGAGGGGGGGYSSQSGWFWWVPTVIEMPALDLDGFLVDYQDRTGIPLQPEQVADAIESSNIASVAYQGVVHEAIDILYSLLGWVRVTINGATVDMDITRDVERGEVARVAVVQVQSAADEGEEKRRVSLTSSFTPSPLFSRFLSCSTPPYPTLRLPMPSSLPVNNEYGPSPSPSDDAVNDDVAMEVEADKFSGGKRPVAKNNGVTVSPARRRPRTADASTVTDFNDDEKCTSTSMDDLDRRIAEATKDVAVEAAKAVVKELAFVPSLNASLPTVPAEVADPRLNGFFEIIAGADDACTQMLKRLFPSYTDLEATAKCTKCFSTKFKSTLSTAHITRLEAISDYISKGNTWRNGLSLDDIVKSLGPPSNAQAALSVAASSRNALQNNVVLPEGFDPLSLSLRYHEDMGRRIEGREFDENGKKSKEWFYIEAALTETLIEINEASNEYRNKCEEAIIEELSHKFQTKLIKYGSQPPPKVVCDGDKTRTLVTLMLRCYHYNVEADKSKACKLQVKVETYLDDKDDTKVYVKQVHKCDPNIDYSQKQEGMTRWQRDYVDLLYDNGLTVLQIEALIVGLEMTNKEVVRKLRLYGNDGNLPTQEQIKRRVGTRGRDGGLVSASTISEMTELCEESSAIPELEDDPFVLHYHFNSIDDFCIVMSSTKLLKKFALTSRRASNGTYKLLKSGFPVLIYGVDDADGHYHPIVIAVASTERAKDFKFVADAVEKYAPTSHPIIHLMSDAAEAIRNGLADSMKAIRASVKTLCNNVSDGVSPSSNDFNEEINTATASMSGPFSASSSDSTTTSLENETSKGAADAPILQSVAVAAAVAVASYMCYFHKKDACRKMATGRTKKKDGKPADGSLKNTAYWEGHNGHSLKDDIEALHNIPHPHVAAFDVALHLFWDKWEKLGEVGFVEYHKKTWGGDARRWAICHHPLGFSTSNNGLERNNRTIKLIAAHRRQLVVPFFRFMNVLVKIWGRNSKEVVTPASRPPLKEADWRNYEGYLRERDPYGVLEVEDEVEGEVFIPSMASFKHWKNIALDDSNVTKSDEEIEASILQQRDGALHNFRKLWRAMKSGKKSNIRSAVESFDEFASLCNSFYVLTSLPVDEARQDMRHSCTCPQYARDHGRCKHATYEGVRKKLFRKPVQFERLERGKSKGGRPKKTSKSLEKQEPDLK